MAQQLYFFRFGDMRGRDPLKDYPFVRSLPLPSTAFPGLTLTTRVTIWVITNQDKPTASFLQRAYQVDPGDINNRLKDVAERAIAGKDIAFVGEFHQEGNRFFAILTPSAS